MATAEAYDQWDDPGLAFSEEQCAAYDSKAVAAVRVNELLERVPLALRRSQLGEKAKWWETTAAKMLDCVTWYCVVAELPGIDREEAWALPTEEAALRALTVHARQLGDEADFVDAWLAAVRAELRQHVSLGRRCVSARKVSGWGKAERSLSNKMANALTKELTAAAKCQTGLLSRTARKAEDESPDGGS